MATEKDNNHASNVTVTAEQATKINEAHCWRIVKNGVVSEAGSGSEKGEEGAETTVAVAVDDESRSKLKPWVNEKHWCCFICSTKGERVKLLLICQRHDD
ncbi:hypothetical protein Bca4012_061039 [Brassica carinata]